MGTSFLGSGKFLMQQDEVDWDKVESTTKTTLTDNPLPDGMKHWFYQNSDPYRVQSEMIKRMQDLERLDHAVLKVSTWYNRMTEKEVCIIYYY